MKTLNISLMVNGRNEGLSKAFRKVATQYAEFAPSIRLPFEINELPFIPDLVFIQIQDDKIRDGRREYLTSEMLGPSMRRLKEKGSFIINWTGDKRNETPHWMIHFAPSVSVTAFSNQQDVDNVRSTGHASEFLQIGIDPEVFKKYNAFEAPEIVFMGNSHGRYPLSQDRVNMVNFLNRTYGNRFGVWGHGYQSSRGSLNASGHDPFPMQSQESRIYSNCKIGISMSHYNSDRYTSDRLLRIMGSNCFALSHHFEGIEKDFRVGHDLDTFRDNNQLKEKIDFYLANDKERSLIRNQGFELVHSKHTYDCMVQDMIKLMK